MGSDRGQDAYRRENKMTTTMLWSLLSSLISLHCMLAMSLTAAHSYSSVGSFVALGLWVRMVLLSVGTGYVVVGGVGRSTAGIHCCWAVDVVPWVLAIICRSLSSWHAAFDWAVVICRAAGLFVLGVV